MKTAIVALAGLALAGIACAMPAQAQGVPRGSYLRSCTDVRVEGDTLVARCRRADGREERTALRDVGRCVGDIGNNNGNLQCSYGGPPRAQAPYPEPRHGQAPGPSWQSSPASAAVAWEKADGERVDGTSSITPESGLDSKPRSLATVQPVAAFTSN